MLIFILFVRTFGIAGTTVIGIGLQIDTGSVFIVGRVCTKVGKVFVSTCGELAETVQTCTTGTAILTTGTFTGGSIDVCAAKMDIFFWIDTHAATNDEVGIGSTIVLAVAIQADLPVPATIGLASTLVMCVVDALLCIGIFELIAGAFGSNTDAVFDVTDLV